MIWPPGKSKAVALVGVTYAVALGVAVAVGLLARELWPALHPLWVVALADLAATVVVFVASVLADNSSFYDPYWSLQPLAIAGYLLWLAPASACGSRQLLVVAPVVLWGARLTFNWLRGWRGLGQEDWRYVDIRGWSGRWYWPTSFAAIHLLPTVFVYLGCLALCPALSSARPLGALDLLAAAVTLAAIWIEAAADRQLFRHRQRGGHGTLASGLWALCRHPNYFGEICFWWGLFLFAVAADPRAWWTVVGPLAITLLFVLISLPLIERRMLERRPDYRQSVERVSALVPWFPRGD